MINRMLRAVLIFAVLTAAAGCAAKEGAVSAPGCGDGKVPGSAPAGAVQSAPDYNSTARNMLRSAGRAPGVQPEAGFSLSVPEKVRTGEPFFVSFGGEGLKEARIKWSGRTTALLPGKGGQGEYVEIVLPVKNKEKEKSKNLTIVAVWKNGKTETFSAAVPVEVVERDVQRLTVKQKYVTPDPSVTEKIKRDREEIKAVTSQFTPVKYWNGKFMRPVPGEVSSTFGLRRIFNGQERNPHSGVDFRAKAGDPIHAMADGKAVLVAEHYYGGNTVAVDHGLGVVTLYLHMTEFAVKQGDTVKRGQVIGYIGSTGRATGPHLHLSVNVMGDSVDALPLLEE